MKAEAVKADSMQSAGQNHDLLTYNSEGRQRKELWFMTSSQEVTEYVLMQ